MTGSVQPGPPSSPEDALIAREYRRLLRDELPRVRAAAVAWRNGLAGLLAAIAGFSLIRGRSDISQLARPWDVVVGLLLLGALITGGGAALLLLRAANGPPRMTSVAQLRPVGMADHLEARAAVRALRRGIATSFGCAALLAAAVGITWYGPANNETRPQAVAPVAAGCGLAAHCGTEFAVGADGRRFRATVNGVPASQ